MIEVTPERESSESEVQPQHEVSGNDVCDRTGRLVAESARSIAGIGLEHLAALATKGHQEGKRLQAKHPYSEYPILAELLYGDDNGEE